MTRPPPREHSAAATAVVAVPPSVGVPADSTNRQTQEMEVAQATATRYDRLHAWVVAHDDSKLFLLLYIGLALVLSVVISLFWLAALVAVHLAFEYVRCRHEGAEPGRALAGAAWGVRLDIALVLFALVLAIYLQVLFGILGLHALGRAGTAVQAGVRGGVRFASWERVIRGFLLSVDDAVQGARALTAFKPASGAAAAVADEVVAPASSVERRWGVGVILTLILGGGSLALLLASPWLAGQTLPEILATLAIELHPYPSR